MIVKCDNCGKSYERFNSGGYQADEPHVCNRRISIADLLFSWIQRRDEKLAQESWKCKE